MKRKIIVTLTALSLILVPASVNAEETEMVEAETEESSTITFRGIPWGTSVLEANRILGKNELAWESSMTYSSAFVDDLLYGTWENSMHNEYDISIVAQVIDSQEIEVAGYVTYVTKLYFSCIPVDGILTKNEEDTALYAAQYFFIANDFEAMSQDLIEKLTSMYGDYSETHSGIDPTYHDGTYAVWYDEYGAALSMNITSGALEDETEQIVITYAYLEGDEWLQNAYDLAAAESQERESGVYGNGNTDGL